MGRRWVTIGAGTAIALVCVGSVFGEHGLLALSRMRSEEARLAARAEALEAENAHLREEVKRLKEDDRYLERVARESQGLVKDGETVYRFP